MELYLKCKFFLIGSIIYIQNYEKIERIKTNIKEAKKGLKKLKNDSPVLYWVGLGLIALILPGPQLGIV